MSTVTGCWYYPRQGERDCYLEDRIYLPLVDSDFHSTILDTAASTTLKQTYTSPRDAIKRCTYTFPLYDGISIVSFNCRFGETVLKGVVRGKKQAEAIFDAAVQQGETAALFEQSDDASDIFTTTLGNIPANTTVIVEVNYVGELKHDAEVDGLKFIIPTHIAPRYGQQTIKADTSAPARSGRINITIDAQMPDVISKMSSPSHPISVSLGMLAANPDANPSFSNASATLSVDGSQLDKDFVCVIEMRDTLQPSALLESHSSLVGHRALMVQLVPKFAVPTSLTEIVLVADRSGSMRSHIPMLKTALEICVKSLPQRVKFNICSFGTRYTAIFDKSQDVSEATVQQAIQHISTFASDYGGTKTKRAIRAMIEARCTDIPLDIILLTDGDIWDQNGLFTYLNDQVATSKDGIRVFPLGIGGGVSHALIEGVARAGNGFAQSVQAGERMDKRVMRMLRGALSPHITNHKLELKYDENSAVDDFEVIDSIFIALDATSIDTDGGKLPDDVIQPVSLFDVEANPELDDLVSVEIPLPKVARPKMLQAPDSIPSLFPFSRTTVYVLLSPDSQQDPTMVILSATTPDGIPLRLEIPVRSSASGQLIHQLAARKAVQDLEEGRGWLRHIAYDQSKPHKARSSRKLAALVEQEAVCLGEKFQIAGKFTSFVAVPSDSRTGENDITPLHTMPAVHGRGKRGSSASLSTSTRACRESAIRKKGGGNAGMFTEPLARGDMPTIVGPYARRLPRKTLFGGPPSQSYALDAHDGGSLFSQSPAKAAFGTANSFGTADTPRVGLFGGPSTQPCASDASAACVEAFTEGEGSDTEQDHDLWNCPPPPAPGLSSSTERGSTDMAPDQATSSEVNADSKKCSAEGMVDTVHQLISLQSFEGYWSSQDSDRIQRLLRTSMPCVTTSSENELSHRIELTKQVIIFLVERASSEKEIWEFVVDKAVAWLQQFCSDGN